MKPEESHKTIPAAPESSDSNLKLLKLGKIPGNSQFNDAPIDYSDFTLDKKVAQEIFGTYSIPAIIGITNAILRGVGGMKDGAWIELAVNMIWAMKPRDTVEAMLLAQLVMLYDQMPRMISMSRRDALDIVFVSKALHCALEITKTYMKGMETLGHYRAGGKHQVVVSYINVEPGSQAAVAVGCEIKGGRANDSKQSTT